MIEFDDYFCFSCLVNLHTLVFFFAPIVHICRSKSLLLFFCFFNLLQDVGLKTHKVRQREWERVDVFREKRTNIPWCLVVSFLAIGVLQLVWQPVKTFIKAVPRGGTCCLKNDGKIVYGYASLNCSKSSLMKTYLNVPVPVSQWMKPQFVRDLGSVHGVR